MRCYQTRWVESEGSYIEVPCGKCLTCLVNKRNDWAFRLEQEYKRSSGAAFVTLTYHPKFCPDYGLDKKHVQLYMKRLRKSCGQKLRYFAVGEYGTKCGRPHYHIILFNYGDKDIRLDREIIEAWSTREGEAFGIVDIRPLNSARIMYCTKYVIQRGNAGSRQYTKPFMLCSRAYGLGAHYLTDDMVEWHRKGQRNYTLCYGEKRRLPRFYRDKIWFPAKRKDRQPVWREHPDRRVVSARAKNEALAAEQKNLQIIRDAGYKDPEAIQAEMRNALLSRVKEKVAYTQIF